MEISDEKITINYKIPKVVQHNVRQLLMKQQNGIWGSKLPAEYKKSFKKDLEYFNYGCGSVLHMCVELNYICKVVKHFKGDFKIFDIRQDTPASILTTEDLKLPSGVCQYDEIIPRTQLCATNDMFQIKISDIYDPSKFWFYSMDNEKKLNEVMDRMQHFYKSTGKYYNIPTYQLKEGLYCAAIICNEFHRGVIVNVVPELMHSIKVFFIDYGTLDLINVKNLYFLHESFKEPNALAMRGRLALVKPIGLNMPWPEAAVTNFQQLVKLKTLLAQVHSNFRDGEIMTYCIKLYDKVPGQNYWIHEKLIEDHMAITESQEQDEAQSIPEFINNSQLMHLVPPMGELESGFAPNRFELNIMRDMDYPWHKILRSYIKKP